jgi:hypothetical protein
LNLRPPGPQPGALPDCATPRGWKKAGDGNRTRPRSLEGFCATTTPRPHKPTLILPTLRLTGQHAGGARGPCRRESVSPAPYGLSVSHRPLALVSGLTLGDYLLWNWSLNGNHEVLALLSGLTLPPLAIAFVWLLALTAGRLIARSTVRSGARARAGRRSAPRHPGRAYDRPATILDGEDHAADATTTSQDASPGKLAA